MKPLRIGSGVLAAALLAAVLTGCSLDAVIWGPDGARVIATTEVLIEEVASGEPSDLLCDDSVAVLGVPGDWRGLSAGEPERFFAEYWEDQVPLDPQWNINLEGLPDGIEPGSEFPGDVFYRETEDGLCVVDIAWATLVEEG